MREVASGCPWEGGRMRAVVGYAFGTRWMGSALHGHDEGRGVLLADLDELIVDVAAYRDAEGELFGATRGVCEVCEVDDDRACRGNGLVLGCATDDADESELQELLFVARAGRGGRLQARPRL